MNNHYHTLGLEEGASQEEIQEAYDRLYNELDPLNNNQEFFLEEYEKVQAAYKFLRNSSILSITSQTQEESLTSASTKRPKTLTIKPTKPVNKNFKIIIISIGILSLIIIAFLFYPYSPYVINRYLNQGVTKMDSKDYKGAIADFTKVIELNPNYFNYCEAYYNRGYSKNELKNYQGAIADYTKAIKLDPNYSDAYFNRGVSKANLQNYRGAIVDYTKAIKLNPNDCDAYLSRGNSKGILDDYRGAIADYSKAIKLNPDFSQAYYNRGSYKGFLGEYRGAIADFTKSLEIEPNDSFAYYLRGLYKIFLKDKNGACLDWSKAGELGNENAYNRIKEYCN